MPASPAHLVARFFDYLTAHSLSVVEMETVQVLSSPQECDLFFAQPPADQRHGYEAALTVLGRGHDRVVVRAALLHDVGKRHAHVGGMGRVLASILIGLHLPLTRAMRAYRDHGEAGARELKDAGSPPLVVEFARAHHGRRPLSIEPRIWRLLQEADRPPKAGGLLKRAVSWGSK